MTVSGQRRSGAPVPVRAEALWAAARYLVLTALCVLCYGNSLHGELVHDDVWAIVNNPDVRPGSSLKNIFKNDFWGKSMSDNTSHKSYRPLTILTFRLNVLLGGLTPVYFHVVNLCLHGAVSCLLMFTCRTCVFHDSTRAFVTALLFAAHPIHTEAVSGVVGRADVLACFLFLLTFLSYVRSVCVCSPWFLWLSLLLGTCAMLVKETGVTVFGVCAAFDALVLSAPLLVNKCPDQSAVNKFSDQSAVNKCPDQSVVNKNGPLVCVGGSGAGGFFRRVALISAYVLLIMSVRLWLMGGSMPLFSEQDNPASFSPYRLTRTLTYLYLLVLNARLLALPSSLCYDWQVGSVPLVETLSDLRNGATMLFLLGMTGLCLCCYARKQQRKEVLVGLLFLVFPFIPASNLFFRVGFVVAERVLYMPSMGYCILLVHGLGRFCLLLGRWGTTVLSVTTVSLLLLFSWKTVQQNHVWLSREALFKSGLHTLPHNAKVHYNYANFLKDSGRLDEAVRHYTDALRLYPRHASAMNNLGTLTQSAEEAERHYRSALSINPQHNRALFNLGNLLKSQGKLKEAESLLMESIHFGPYFADAYSSLASLYAEQKHFAEANTVYRQGIEKCPDNSDLHNNYGVFLVDAGEAELAAAHYLRAIQLKPAHHVAMVNLGRLLRSTNDNQAAESWYRRALQVNRQVEVLAPLGALYFNTGRFQEALQVYREAAALRPTSTDIGLALAQVLAVSSPQSSEAEQMILDLISKQNQCFQCYRLLSALYSQRGNYSQAVEALNVALQNSPSDDVTMKAELHFSKGNQLREMNQLDQAFQSYKLAVDLKPDQSQAWMNMGGIQHMKGDYAAARMYYQRALLLNPGSKLLKENLAKLDRLQRKLEQ